MMMNENRLRKRICSMQPSHRSWTAEFEELPIEIIQHIQSFMDAKGAVRTSLVSKHWHQAWSTGPILVLHVLRKQLKNYEIWDSVLERMKRYKDSSNKLDKLVLHIIHHYQGIDYGYRNVTEPAIVNQLLADASALGLTELDFSLHPKLSDPDSDPIQLFAIPSLTKLSVRGGRQIEHPGRILCSHLVSLRLNGNLKCILLDTIRRILMACPLIENLALLDLHLHSMGKSDYVDDESTTFDRVLCPRLRSFSYNHISFTIYFVDPVRHSWIRDLLLGSPLFENMEYSRPCPIFHLPSDVFMLRSFRRLSVSRSPLIIDNGLPRCCSGVLSLRCTSVTMSDDTIRNILLACPLIENLDLEECKGVLNIDVSNSHNLVNLRIQDCCPKVFFGLEYYRLRSVSLVSVTLNNEFFTKFSSRFPCVENLTLDRCNGFTSIQISSRSVKYLQLRHHQTKLRKAEFDLPDIDVSNLQNLVTLRIQDCPKVFFGSEYRRLRSVSLVSVTVNNEFFTKFSSRFPCVENLTLDRCNGFTSIQISSRSIKYLQLRHHQKKLRKAEFDLPDIRKFVFDTEHGHVPSLSFHTTSIEWESEVKLSCSMSGIIGSRWFVKLREFLKELRLSRISLEVCFRTNPNPLVCVKNAPCTSTRIPAVENLQVDNNTDLFNLCFAAVLPQNLAVCSIDTIS